MTWQAQLNLNYTLENGRTVARHHHTGPLRILQSLYPEGDTVCHNVLVHPPGGLVGWDITALGLPLASQPFVQGYLRQHIEMPGVWMERGSLQANDTRLLQSPVGLAGQACMGTLFFMAGTALPRARKEQALELARDLISQHATAPMAGATSPHPRVLVVRVLAPVVEPAMHLLRQIRNVWRSQLWAQRSENPRIWSM